MEKRTFETFCCLMDGHKLLINYDGEGFKTYIRSRENHHQIFAILTHHYSKTSEVSVPHALGGIFTVLFAEADDGNFCYYREDGSCVKYMFTSY